MSVCYRQVISSDDKEEDDKEEEDPSVDDLVTDQMYSEVELLRKIG